MIDSATKSNTKAVLSLYIDGKKEGKEDLYECIHSLNAIDDVTLFIEELFLLTLYVYLFEKKELSKLDEHITYAKRKKSGLKKNVKGVVLSYKLLFIECLLGNKVSIEESAKHIINLENYHDIENLSILGSLCLLISISGNNGHFFEQGKAISELVISGLNKQGEIDCFFLFSEGEYKKDTSRVALFTLITLYKRVYTKCSEAMLDNLDPFQGGLFQSIDVEQKLLLRMLEGLDNKTCPKIMSSTSKKSDFITKSASNGFSFKTAAGKKVGIGSISYKNELVVPSFGPHIYPLGRKDYYGLSTPILSNIEMGEKISMWNRVKQANDYGNNWIYSSLDVQAKSLQFESFVWKKEEKERLGFLFFIRATKLEINGNFFQSDSLSRSLVTTNKILLHREKKRMLINIEKSISVEIIPLAGQEYFFNSDFIIAFPYQSGELLNFSFNTD